jgi:hypothetical protein
VIFLSSNKKIETEGDIAKEICAIGDGDSN